jgi:hypothetical protein
MVQKIGMFVLVTFALIALITQPETVGQFVEAIGSALRAAAEALSEIFDSVN